MRGLLNESQATSLRITLQILEERLREVRGYLEGTQEEAILYRRVMPLCLERRAEAERAIDEALAEVAALARALAFEPEPDDLSAAIRGLMSASWVDLGDARSSTLKRFGSVDPALAAALDPAVARLAELVMSIAVLMTVSPGE